MPTSTPQTQPAPDDHVTVPPGHKVVVLRAVESPVFARSESGMHIVQMGKDGHNQILLDSVSEFANNPSQAGLVWIIPTAFLDSLSDEAAFLSKLEGIVTNSKGRKGHVAVVPHASARQYPVMRKLRDIGMGIHLSAEDGSCFVEVHKPEGIVIGMPGKPFTE